MEERAGNRLTHVQGLGAGGANVKGKKRTW